MGMYNCAALYRFPDRIEVWFDAIGRPGIKRIFPPDQTDLPTVGTLYDEADIVPTAVPNPAPASGIGRLKAAFTSSEPDSEA